MDQKFKATTEGMRADYDKKLFEANAQWDTRIKTLLANRDDLRNKEMRLKDECQAL